MKSKNLMTAGCIRIAGVSTLYVVYDVLSTTKPDLTIPGSIIFL
jgi:hypothetical protein